MKLCVLLCAMVLVASFQESDAILLSQLVYPWRWMRMQLYRWGARKALSRYGGPKTAGNTTNLPPGGVVPTVDTPLEIPGPVRVYGQPPEGWGYPQPPAYPPYPYPGDLTGNAFYPYPYIPTELYEALRQGPPQPENDYVERSPEIPERQSKAISEEKVPHRNPQPLGSQPPMELLFPANYENVPLFLQNINLPGAPEVNGTESAPPPPEALPLEFFDVGHYRKTWTGGPVFPLQSESDKPEATSGDETRPKRSLLDEQFQEAKTHWNKALEKLKSFH